MRTLGINIGSSNVKAVMLEGNEILWSEVVPHEGNFLGTLSRILSFREMPEGVRALVTGTEGRYLLNISSVIEPICVEAALGDLEEEVDAVVSLGGEDLVVYTVNESKRIITSFSGNKCASGTGEFFKQQLGRMDMGLDAVDRLEPGCRVHKLSSRCSRWEKTRALRTGRRDANHIRAFHGGRRSRCRAAVGPQRSPPRLASAAGYGRPAGRGLGLRPRRPP